MTRGTRVKPEGSNASDWVHKSTINSSLDNLLCMIEESSVRIVLSFLMPKVWIYIYAFLYLPLPSASNKANNVFAIEGVIRGTESILQPLHFHFLDMAPTSKAHFIRSSWRERKKERLDCYSFPLVVVIFRLGSRRSRCWSPI